MSELVYVQRLVMAIVDALAAAHVEVQALEDDGHVISGRDDYYDYVFEWRPISGQQLREARADEAYHVKTNVVAARPLGASRTFGRHLELEHVISNAITAERNASAGMREKKRT